MLHEFVSWLAARFVVGPAFHLDEVEDSFSSENCLRNVETLTIPPRSLPIVPSPCVVLDQTKVIVVQMIYFENFMAPVFCMKKLPR